MKQKQRIAFFGMVAVALILAACDGDRGNNSTETEGDSSSSAEIYSSSGQINSSSVVKSSSSSVPLSSSTANSSSSSVKGSSSSAVVLSSSAKVQSSSSVPLSSSVVKLSSSSVPLSSSSTIEFSSSSSIKYGTFIYGGQTYKTVTIGTQTWMAENLNYADSTAMPNLKGNSWCYRNSADNCAKYGRLYTWTAAMNIDSSYQSTKASAMISTLQQGVCPTGWHIPTNEEWKMLENAVGGRGVAGMKLKSTSGWFSNGNGTDSYGFSARSAGFRTNDGDFYNVNNYGYWWTATEYGSLYAFYRNVIYNDTRVLMDTSTKTTGRSLRCLKD